MSHIYHHYIYDILSFMKYDNNTICQNCKKKISDDAISFGFSGFFIGFLMCNFGGVDILLSFSIILYMILRKISASGHIQSKN